MRLANQTVSAKGVALASVLACVGVAGAQDGLIVGTENANTEIKIYRNSAWATLTGTVGATGLAADNQSCTLWISTNFQLYRYSRGELTPTLVGDFTVEDQGQTFTMSLQGLAWTNGRLFGSRSPGSFDVPEGIYEVNPTNARCTPVWTSASTPPAFQVTFDLNGFEADEQGNFYATNDPQVIGGSQPDGMYRIELAPTFSATRVTAYRALNLWPGRGNTPDVDGLAIGGGKAYMIIDEPGAFAVYNFATSQYEANIPSPWSTTNVAAGGAWGPCFNRTTPTCVADLDDGSGAGNPDGAVTLDDLLYFLGQYESGSIRADVDDGSSTGTRDQAVTVDDLLYFLLRYEQGC